MTVYRLFPSASGPSAATPDTGNYLAGVVFQVTANGLWLQGFWWWVCNTGQQAGAQEFALWQVHGTGAGLLVPGTTVTSGPLTAGQWNYVPLTAPVALSAGIPYVAATGYVSATGFPLTQNQFGSGQPFSAGITNGPLSAYSDGSGSAPVPHTWLNQGIFGTGSADPSAAMPASGFNSGNFWMDAQVADTAPAGASYRLWPGLPDPPDRAADTADNFTLATEFTLSQACALDRIWFYSPAGTTQLPTECGIWLVSSQALVPGTHNASPSWSGAAGSGWVSCSYSGVTLPAGDYKTSVFNGAAVPVVWNSETSHYWDTGGGGSGITAGPLSAPGESGASSPGQSSYHLGPSFAWPDTYATGLAANYWVDPEVTPVTPAGLVPPLVSQFSGLY